MKIGIALAAYRPDIEFFEVQLQSLCAQTHQDWVCWVSLDSPLDELRNHSKLDRFFKDQRFHWSENSIRLGHLKNFERATQAVLGLGVKAIAFCDQDDLWFEAKLERSAIALEKLGSNSLVFCDMRLVDAGGSVGARTAWEVERRGVRNLGSFDLIVRNVVAGAGALMDAELVRIFPLIPAQALFHDHWYPIIAAKVGRIEPLCEVLYDYRLHGGNVAGITPFRGRLASNSSSKMNVFRKSAGVWRRSNAMARVIESDGPGLSLIERLAFLTPWDFGTLLIIRGFACFFTDPALARACFARALGKLLWLCGI